MTTLVTGASGQVGSSLVHALCQRGEKVRVLLRDGSWHPLLKDLEVEVLRGNLLNAGDIDTAVQGCEKVFHVAGSISYLPQDRWQMMQVNVHATDLLVHAALKHGVKKFVHTSSTAALGYTQRPELLDESARLTGSLKQVAYLHTKALAEKRIQHGVNRGLVACMVNPSTILGPGDIKGNSQNMYAQVKSGRVMCPPGGTAIVSLPRVIEGHLKAMDTLNTHNTGERYILSSFNWPFERVFQEIARATGQKSPQMLALPRSLKPIMKAAARASARLKPALGLSGEVIDFSFGYRYYNSQKAQQHLPWEPDTLESMHAALRAAHVFYSDTL